MKQAMKESAPFQREGIMSISRSLSGNVDAKVKRWVESAKRQGQDLDKMSEQEIRYLIELNKPKAPKVYSNEEAYKILNRFANQNKRGEVFKADFGKPIAEEVVTVERVVTDIKKMKPIDSMKEANKVLKGEGRYKSLSKADRKKIVDDESVTDHIFERNIKPDPDDPEFMAQGGRTGFQNGAVAFPEEEETQSAFAPGKVLRGLGKLAQFGLTIGTGGIMNPKTIGKAILRDQVGKKIVRPVILKGLDKAYSGGSGGTSIGGGQQTSSGIAGGAISHSAAKEARGDMSGWGLAEGGRLGLSYLLAEDTNERMPFKMGRRAFLKLMGGVGAGIGALKAGALKLFGKEGATVAKEVTQVPIKNIEGMPSWFKPLVNKVIREGEDMTKQFATKEREIVHATKIGVDDHVRVTQSLDDGTVRVEYDTVHSPGEYGVDLIYKKGEEIPTKKGLVKTKDEFTAAEAEPRYTGGPEDADLEWDGENLVNNIDDLLTDTTKLEAYATGKKPNIKKLLKSEQKQKKTQQLNESNAEQANFIEEKYGPGPDPSDLVDDYASGGLARMLGE